MKKLIVAIVVLSAIVVLAGRCKQKPDGGGLGGRQPITQCYCADSSQCDRLCSVLPTGPDMSDPKLFPNGYQATLDSVHQPPFDIFSWQAFVALNWPANSDGKPLGTPIGSAPKNKRVWEYFETEYDLLGDTTGCEICQTDCDVMVARVSKGRFVVNPDGSFVEADGNALIDKNLNFAVFEVRANPTEAEYVRFVKSHLDSIDKVDFPTGSIEIKTSWRILDTTNQLELNRYYHRRAVIYVAKENSLNNQPLCIKATLGLVGMHIAYKVASVNHLDPWIWSTFEHIDNVPASLEEAQMMRERPSAYSFYNPLCVNCPPNKAPTDGKTTIKWSPTPPYAAHYATQAPKGEGEGMDRFGTQAVREFPIYYTTQLVNKEWQAMLKNTVWANYQLVGTQWGTTPDGPPFDVVNFVPVQLANTTLETFVQLSPMGSCGKCHGFATLVIGKDTLDADHSFLIGNLGQ